MVVSTIFYVKPYLGGNWWSNLTVFWQSYGLVQPPTRKHLGVLFDLFFFLGRMELFLAPFHIKSWYPPSRNFRRQPEMSGLFQGFLKKKCGASRCWGVTCGMDQDDVVFLLTSYPHLLKTQLLGGDLSKKKWWVIGPIDEILVHKNIKWSMCPFKGCYNYTPPNETNRSNSIMF